jgi:hypothetical protein
VNWLVGQSVLLGLPVENWTMLSFIVAMTSFVSCGGQADRESRVSRSVRNKRRWRYAETSGCSRDF